MRRVTLRAVLALDAVAGVNAGLRGLARPVTGGAEVSALPREEPRVGARVRDVAGDAGARRGGVHRGLLERLRLVALEAGGRARLLLEVGEPGGVRFVARRALAAARERAVHVLLLEQLLRRGVAAEAELRLVLLEDDAPTTPWRRWHASQPFPSANGACTTPREVSCRVVA